MSTRSSRISGVQRRQYLGGVGPRGQAAVGITMLIVVALTTPFITPSAAAVDPSLAICVARWRDALAPGATTSVARLQLTSQGETGTITCSGVVRGHPVVSPGTIAERGTADGTCLAGSGTSTLSLTIPTTAGNETFDIPVAFTYAGGAGLRTSDVFPGGFAFLPTQGDCVTAPITEIDILLHGVLRS